MKLIPCPRCQPSLLTRLLRGPGHWCRACRQEVAEYAQNRERMRRGRAPVKAGR